MISNSTLPLNADYIYIEYSNITIFLIFGSVFFALNILKTRSSTTFTISQKLENQYIFLLPFT